MWEELAGDPVVDIRSVRSPYSGLRYAVKYVLKPPKFPSAGHYLDFLETFDGKPLAVAFGGLWGADENCEYQLVCESCGSTRFLFVTVCLSEEVEWWIGEGIGEAEEEKPPPY